MPTSSIGGQRTFYAARNLDRRPVLLLIHGAGGSHLDWPPQLRRFDHLGTCAVDLPGHGRSEPPARSTVGDYADHVLQLVDLLGVSNIVLVGHSMGGAVALSIALRQPAQVSALVLVATGARLRVNEHLLTLIGNNFDSAVEHIETAAWGPDASPEMVDRGSQLMLAGDPVAMHMDFLACNQFDVMHRLSSIQLPTLVLVGTDDRMTPPKYAHYLAEQIPRAELVVIAGTGHMLAMERPTQTRDAINDFIQRRIITH